MAIPGYLFLTDENGKIIRGGVNVRGRENSIEILGYDHCISLPVDDGNGNVTATRHHIPFMIEKEVDSSTPFLYQALTTGKMLRSAELKLYNINYSGQDEEYFNILMENVHVVNISPVMFDIKDRSKEKFNHMEAVEFRYQTIGWRYLDGNIIYRDDWNQR